MQRTRMAGALGIAAIALAFMTQLPSEISRSQAPRAVRKDPPRTKQMGKFPAIDVILADATFNPQQRAITTEQRSKLARLLELLNREIDEIESSRIDLTRAHITACVERGEFTPLTPEMTRSPTPASGFLYVQHPVHGTIEVAPTGDDVGYLIRLESEVIGQGKKRIQSLFAEA